MNKEEHIAGLVQYVLFQANNLLKRKELDKSLYVKAVCLYGGAAKYLLKEKDYIKDYDVQVYLSKLNNYKIYDSAKFNRKGGIWPAGEFNGKPVELFFGTLPDYSDLTTLEKIFKYIKNHNSERWIRIKKDPYIILWPERMDYKNLSNI